MTMDAEMSVVERAAMEVDVTNTDLEDKKEDTEVADRKVENMEEAGKKVVDTADETSMGADDKRAEAMEVARRADTAMIRTVKVARKGVDMTEAATSMALVVDKKAVTETTRMVAARKDVKSKALVTNLTMDVKRVPTLRASAMARATASPAVPRTEVEAHTEEVLMTFLAPSTKPVSTPATAETRASSALSLVLSPETRIRSRKRTSMRKMLSGSTSSTMAMKEDPAVKLQQGALAVQLPCKL